MGLSRQESSQKFAKSNQQVQTIQPYGNQDSFQMRNPVHANNEFNLGGSLKLPFQDRTHSGIQVNFTPKDILT